MDISTFGKSGYRLKGKNSIVSVERGVVAIGQDNPFRIDAPGEYEVGGVSVVGVNDSGAKIYVIEVDAMRVGVLDLVTGKLSEKQIEEMGPVDILITPEVLPDVNSQVDPWVIISEKGTEASVPIPKYSITHDKLPTETLTIVLERKD